MGKWISRGLQALLVLVGVTIVASAISSIAGRTIQAPNSALNGAIGGKR